MRYMDCAGVAVVMMLTAAGVQAQPCDLVSPPLVADLPDSAFADSNGDGIDGMGCGPIFVDFVTGTDLNPGTMAQPMKSIGAAVLAARAMTPIRPVYVSKGIYNENVVFAPGVSVHGGYDGAAAWARSVSNVVTVKSVTTTPAFITDPASTAPGATVIDMITFDGTGQTPGTLNAAVVVRNMNAAGVTFTACTFKPGAGSAGSSAVPAPAGSPGSAGANGAFGSCDDDNVNAAGGSGGISPTSGREGGVGGSGGKGNMTGGPGQTGLSGGGTFGPGGGAGDPGMPGGNGGTGAAGTAGTNGGAGQPFIGTGQGGSGTAGLPGYGGGGGGGGAGNGGSGGAGGGGGGSSVGVYVQSASSAVALAACQFNTMAGGAGGNAGPGGAGGAGGLGGTGGSNCVGEVGRGGNGGKGGDGGSGGPGGGGAGGSSVGVLMFSASSVSTPGSNFLIASAGSGGTSTGLPGVTGISANTYTAAAPVGISASTMASAIHARLTAPYGGISAPTRAWQGSQNNGITQLTTTGPLTFGASPHGTPLSSGSGQITFSPMTGFSGWTSFTFSFGSLSGIATVYVTPPAFSDCNGNGISDATDISNSTSADCDGNGIPDECIAPAPTAITQQPASQAVQVNTSAVFAIMASGPGTLTYSWRRNGLALSNGIGISGADAAILTISPATSALEGSYDCIVTSTCGSAASQCVALFTQCKADFNGTDGVTIDDLFLYLNAYFSGCP